VRYWSSVRTEAEIQQNMTVLIDPSEDNLLAYWRFDEEVNDHIIDLTGNGYDGEIIGNPELVYSSAPIGEFSIFQYDDDTPLFISDDLGNNFILGNFNITPSTVHLYYVSENPMDDTPPSGFDGLWDQSYFGVFSFSSDTQTVTYDVILNYNDQTINIDLSIYELDIAVYPLRGNSNWDRLEGVWSMVGSLVPDWVPGGLFRMSGGGDFIEGDGEGSGNYSMGYGGSSVLPIDLLSFTAKPNENEVILNWITSTEINNSHFTILRSKEGVNFYPIQEIEGSLNSQKVVKYEFVDRDPYGGVSYYRLKQTDIDGSSEKFYIISVELYKPGDLTFVLFPNPSNGGNVYVRMDSEHINQLESTKLEVFDAQGRKVHESYKGDVSVGEQFGFIQSGELNSGVYTVRLTGGEHQVSQQLMVR
ncbi:MAG: T9SS C-terminal target domain-containing protein, partial [Chitinophagaceae bacterium]